jgi:hypothetical protein
MSNSCTDVFRRGGTVFWSTTFYDVNNNVVQPDSATISLVFADGTSDTETATVAMTPPSPPATAWTAMWDSRGALAPQEVTWSIHTGTSDPIPVAVEDGEFRLEANAANLVTF